MNRFNISNEAIDQTKYLVIKPEPKDELIEYLYEMIQRNHIPGILPMHKQMVDGELKLYYDITGKIKLADYISKKTITQKQLQLILNNLVEGFAFLQKYFLKAEFCLLKANHLMIDEKFYAYLAVLPLEGLKNEMESQSVHNFLRDLVGMCIIPDTHDAYYNSLAQYLIKPDFDLNVFRNLVKSPVESTAKAEPAGNKHVDTPAANEPKEDKPLKEEQDQSAEKKGLFGYKRSATATDGVLIPGSEERKEVPKEESKEDLKKKKKEKKQKEEKPPKEKKPFLGLPIGGKKKEPEEKQLQPNDPDINLADPWQGTVMFMDDKTTLLSEIEAKTQSAYLLHNGSHISVDSTPFLLGKTGVNYTFQNKTISRVHAKITFSDGNYYLEDQSSKNFTYLNGTKLAPNVPVQLEDGGRIQLSNEELTFKLDD